jgi:hypothetical protein
LEGAVFKAAITAYLAAERAEGRKIVGREATESMRKATKNVISRHNKQKRKTGEYETGEGLSGDPLSSSPVIWSAMWDAAP